jgi:dTDP-4-dehydrorhamnose 3,5-epimerase
MRLHDTIIPGAFVVDLPRFDDDRGHFSVMWSFDDFKRLGLATDLSQCNMAFNRKAGTLRGMHYQATPWEQTKIVRCSRGAIFDVIIDLRPDSPAYRRWFGIELTPDNSRVLYAPKGVAHGYQTLVDDTEVVYLVTGSYQPAHERGVKWNDPAFGIEWPDSKGPRTINPRDAAFPDFVPAAMPRSRA